MSRVARCGRILAVVAWMGLISYWSSQGNLPIDAPEIAGLLHNLQHRIAHLFAFGTLGLLARWALVGLPRPSLLAVLIVSVFGATDEWHQSFTPGRRPGIDDWALDTASAALALYLWSRLCTSRLVLTRLRPIGALAISLVFVVGIVLAASTRAAAAERSGAGLRNAAHAMVDLARSTRDTARQIRSTLG